MHHVQHEHRVLLESKISEHQLRKRYRAVVMSNYDDNDLWDVKASEAPDLSNESTEIPQALITPSRGPSHVPQKPALIPTYYYPTSYPDAPNHPRKPHDTSYRNHETYGPLLMETTSKRLQSDPDSRHYSYTVDLENHRGTVAEIETMTNGALQKTSDTSETPRPISGNTKRVTMSPDVEAREYQLKSFSEDSEDKDCSSKQQKCPQQQQSVSLGCQKFHDDFPSEMCYEKSKRQSSKPTDDLQLSGAHETPILAKEASGLNNDSPSTEKPKINSEIQKKHSAPPESSQTDMQKPKNLQKFLSQRADQKQKNSCQEKEKRRENAVCRRLLKNKERIGCGSDAPEISLESNFNNNSNNNGSDTNRPFWYRYPSHQQKNKEGDFINSMTATELAAMQKSSSLLTISPSMEQQKLNERGRWKMTPGAIHRTATVANAKEKVPKNGLVLVNFLIHSFFSICLSLTKKKF